MQNELAKLSSALVDAENKVESLKACIDVQKSKLDDMITEEAAGIAVEILPILELKPPKMRAGSKLFKVKFDVEFCSSVIREFMDYHKVPA